MWQQSTRRISCNMPSTFQSALATTMPSNTIPSTSECGCLLSLTGSLDASCECHAAFGCWPPRTRESLCITELPFNERNSLRLAASSDSCYGLAHAHITTCCAGCPLLSVTRNYRAFAPCSKDPVLVSRRFYYAKGMSVDEAYVFVCYDSRADRARFTPHTGENLSFTA